MQVAETWGFATRSLRSPGVLGRLHGDLQVDVRTCNICLGAVSPWGMSDIKPHSLISSIACVTYWDQTQVTSQPSTPPAAQRWPRDTPASSRCLEVTCPGWLGSGWRTKRCPIKGEEWYFVTDPKLWGDVEGRGSWSVCRQWYLLSLEDRHI